MSVFQIRQGRTGAILWTGAAANPMQAIDAMAHEAGYYDHSDLPDTMRKGLMVEELTFPVTRTPTSSGRDQGNRTGQFVLGTPISDRNLDRAAG